MKFIHCADIHLGSRISSFPKEISDGIKLDLLNTFKRTVAYAKSNGIKVIALSGDVFDSDKPFKKDKDFFFSVVKNNPDIDFLYLRGNHDILASGEAEFPNLKRFTDEWTSYTFGDAVFSGIEMNRGNCTSLYSTLSLEKDKYNIVMLHGQTANSVGKDMVNLSKLRGKNIDYLALGHVHEYSSGALDERGVWAYSGCLSGRGFDEVGQKGFIVCDTSARTHTFIPFAERVIYETAVDISDIADAYSAYLKVKGEIAFEKGGIYRVNLTGEVNFETESLSEDLEKYLARECLYIGVKDRTRKKIDITAYEGDLSLRGEFVRSVYADGGLSEEDKLKIISYGLKALKGERL